MTYCSSSWCCTHSAATQADIMDMVKKGKKRQHFTDVPVDSDDEEPAAEAVPGDATTAIIETAIQEADQGKVRSKSSKADVGELLFNRLGSLSSHGKNDVLHRFQHSASSSFAPSAEWFHQCPQLKSPDAD